jgi:hypothetical protein
MESEKVKTNKHNRVITIPAGLWAGIIVLIPAVFVYYSIATADSFKTNFYEESFIC